MDEKKFFTVTITDKYEDVERDKRNIRRSGIASLIMFILCIPMLFLSQNLNTERKVQEDITQGQNTEEVIITDLNALHNLNATHPANLLFSEGKTESELETSKPNVLDTSKGKQASSIDDTNAKKKATTEIKSTKKKSKKPKKKKSKKVKTKYRYSCSDSEYNIFLNIVEAELTGNDPEGVGDYETAVECKLRVAQVILNRVESSKFPNSIEGVVYAPGQFQPISDGRYGTLEISDATREACELALKSNTKDYTEGCVYFAQCWFDWATYHFTDESGHHFYS